MGNLDRANHDARRLPPVERVPHGAVPKPPDNGAAHRAELLDIDMRERALTLAIKAMKQGLTPAQSWSNPDDKALFVAAKFLAFLKGESK